MSLTSEQWWLFRHNGFLKLPEGLPHETVDRLKETIRRHIDETVEPVVRDRQGRVVRISNLWDRDPLFREVLTCPQVLDPLEALLGPNIELIMNRHNHATLRVAGDGSYSFHRDVLQWSRTIATIIFYLEETTLENGCTLVVPGTHLLPGLDALHFGRDQAQCLSAIIEQAVPVPMPAGGLLVIDSLLIHSAGENTTAGSRMSMTVGYHSADELSDVDNPKRILVRGKRVYAGNDRM